MAAAAAARQNTSIEFVVKPREDLYLEGKLRTLPRVQQGDPYPCQMQKNQTFSCLFRHYAKHNGLKKEDLVFYFVDELLPDQMPETVHLMPQDEIWVEHRVKPATAKVEKKPEVSSAVFGQQFSALLRKGWHSDVKFIVGDEREELVAHKAILSARSDFFEAMFRPGGMSESSRSEVEMPEHDKDSFRRMLEFIYGGDVEDLDQCSSSELISLLELSSAYLLEDLGKLCEHAAAKIVNMENIGKMMVFCSRYKFESQLRTACTRFVAEHGRQLRSDPNFRKEIEQFPELGLLILDATTEDEDSGRHNNASSKRRRITDNDNELGGAGAGANNPNSNTIADQQQWP